MAVGDPVSVFLSADNATQMTFQPAAGVRILVTSAVFPAMALNAGARILVKSGAHTVTVTNSDLGTYPTGLSGSGGVPNDGSSRVSQSVRHVIITDTNYLVFATWSSQNLRAFICGWEI